MPESVYMVQRGQPVPSREHVPQVVPVASPTGAFRSLQKTADAITGNGLCGPVIELREALRSLSTYIAALYVYPGQNTNPRYRESLQHDIEVLRAGFHEFVAGALTTTRLPTWEVDRVGLQRADRLLASVSAAEWAQQPRILKSAIQCIKSIVENTINVSNTISLPLIQSADARMSRITEARVAAERTMGIYLTWLPTPRHKASMLSRSSVENVPQPLPKENQRRKIVMKDGLKVSYPGSTRVSDLRNRAGDMLRRHLPRAKIAKDLGVTVEAVGQFEETLKNKSRNQAE